MEFHYKPTKISRPALISKWLHGCIHVSWIEEDWIQIVGHLTYFQLADRHTFSSKDQEIEYDHGSEVLVCCPSVSSAGVLLPPELPEMVKPTQSPVHSTRGM